MKRAIDKFQVVIGTYKVLFNIIKQLVTSEKFLFAMLMVLTILIGNCSSTNIDNAQLQEALDLLRQANYVESSSKAKDLFGYESDDKKVFSKPYGDKIIEVYFPTKKDCRVESVIPICEIMIIGTKTHMQSYKEAGLAYETPNSKIELEWANNFLSICKQNSEISKIIGVVTSSEVEEKIFLHRLTEEVSKIEKGEKKNFALDLRYAGSGAAYCISAGFIRSPNYISLDIDLIVD